MLSIYHWVFTTSPTDYCSVILHCSKLVCVKNKQANSETCLSCFAAKKTNKQVYVSYSLPVTDSNLSLLVEDRIKKELERHPQHF